jgi:ribosomal protein L4
MDGLPTDDVFRDLLAQIRALLTTTAATSYAPYWTMRTAAFAREVQSWSTSVPSPERRAAVHAALRSLLAQIAHHSNAA